MSASSTSCSQVTQEMFVGCQSEYYFVRNTYVNRTVYLITLHFFVFYIKFMLVEPHIHFLIALLKSGLPESLFFIYCMFWFYGSSVLVTFISFPHELSFSIYELSHSSLMFHFNVFVPETSLMFNIHRWKVKFNVSMDSNIY